MRLTYIIGLPPKSEVKKCIPKVRSNESIMSVAVKMGKANTTKINEFNTDQTKSGIFIKVMPGQRILKIVTIKLMPESKVPIPDIWTLQIQ